MVRLIEAEGRMVVARSVAGEWRGRNEEALVKGNIIFSYCGKICITHNLSF